MYGKVSVIIPVYNRQNVVEECVHSVLAQTYSNFEIILIDDGSSDQTVDICRRLSAEDPRIRLLERDHGGVSAARNAGIDAAGGEFLFFLDSDDVIHPQLLQTLVSAMAASGSGMSGTDVRSVKEESWHRVAEHIARTPAPGKTIHQTNEQAIHAAMLGGSPINVVGGVMMRRDLIGETRFRTDLFIGEDFYFVYENLIKGTDVEFLEPRWYFVRIHESNSSWNYGYDGFYTRFLRRKLVWEQENKFGRPQHVRLQKRSAFGVFLMCLNHEASDKVARKKMRAVMKQHAAALFPALTVTAKLHFILSVYTPALYRKSLFSKLSALKKKAPSPASNAPHPQKSPDKTNIQYKAEDHEHHDLLSRFMSMPLASSDDVLAMFESLPNAVCGRGPIPLQRFVYIPGTRKNRVLLVAHTDTFWDTAYGKTPGTTATVFEGGVFRSTDPNQGIGADDRAGCAMLYALRSSGHSLLVLDGEEHGKKGAWYLRKHHKSLFRELNRHHFILEFDWAGAGQCLFNQVDYTPQFKAYIERELGLQDSRKDGGCDLQVLCHKICGVNVSTGYHHCHSPQETLDPAEWEDTLQRMIHFLQKDHPRFPIHKGKRLRSVMRRLPIYLRAAKNKLYKLLH